ncbi:class I adenylate-forming enzyme family protein, partial [Streptomonospora algeriensis]
MAPDRHCAYVLRILDTLRRTPDRPVIRLADGQVAAAEFEGAVRSACASLHASGIGPGTVLAVLSEPNRPLMLVARYAAHLLGAAVVHLRSMNPRSDAEPLPLSAQLGIIRDTGARVAVVDEDNAKRGAELQENAPCLTVLGRLDAPADEAPAPAPYSPEALAVVDFTSGSTTEPKMVRQSYGTHEALLGLLSRGWADRGPATLLSVTPISHTTAPMVDAVLADGGTVVLHEGFDADAVLRSFAQDRVTDVYLAVPHLYRLLEHPGIADADLSSVHRVVYSGTPAAPSRIARAVELFGDRLVQVYGATETGGITSLTPEDHREPLLLGSVGRPFPWVRVELRDPETGRPAAPGEAGEVCVASPTAMDGYLGAADLTEEAVSEGMVRTGDLGRWDQYGYLRLTGRVGRLIKSGGLKIDPAAVEEVLLGHPAVKDASVFGISDDDYVEHIHAAVALREGARCTSEELRRHVAAEAPAAWAP